MPTDYRQDSRTPSGSSCLNDHMAATAKLLGLVNGQASSHYVEPSTTLIRLGSLIPRMRWEPYLLTFPTTLTFFPT